MTIIDQYICIEIINDRANVMADNIEELLTTKNSENKQIGMAQHSIGNELSDAKQLIESIHGRMYCKSELDKGFAFVVEIPKHTNHNSSELQ